MPQLQFKINVSQYLNSLPGRHVGDVKVKLHSHAERIYGSNWPALCSTYLSPGDRAGIHWVKHTAIFKMVRLFFKLSQNREKQECMVKLLAYLVVLLHRMVVPPHQQMEYCSLIPNYSAPSSVCTSDSSGGGNGQGRTRTIVLHRRLTGNHHGPPNFGFSVRGGREHGTGFFVSAVEQGSEAHCQGLKVSCSKGAVHWLFNFYFNRCFVCVVFMNKTFITTGIVSSPYPSNTK